MFQHFTEQVLLVGHVPPGFLARATGVQWFFDRFNSEFQKLLSDFSKAISATIFGHEHTDSFRVVYDPKGQFCYKVCLIFLSIVLTSFLVKLFLTLITATYK